MDRVKSWLLSLFVLLFSTRGDEEIVIPDDQDDDDSDDNDELPPLPGSEQDDDDEGDEDEDDDEEDDDRSSTIPRKRFDKVNGKAQKLDRLIELGIISEDEEGELRLNPEVLKSKTDKPQGSNPSDFRFTKDEVDDASWPLVEKINKGFDHYDQMAGKMAYHLQTLQAENAILRDYPEFLQKNHPLRKKTLDILKNDPEFKKTYKNNPERGYWAAKRASELLEGKQPKMKKKNKKKSFITGRGDGGKGGSKVVSMGSLTSQQLDDLELQEHKRLQNTPSTSKRR